MRCDYSEVMVRAFYQNLHYMNGELTSRVCGVDIVITAPLWTELLGFDFDALPDAVEYDGDSHTIFDGFDRAEVIRETRRPDAEAGQFAQYPVGNLSVSARILHYVVTHIIFQRPHNHSKVLENDFVVLWALIHRVPVNWRHYICMIMYKAAKSGRKAELPYAYLVQRILETFHVPMGLETMKSHGHWNAVFGERLLKSCHIEKRQDGSWQWKTAPVAPDIPDPDDADMEDVMGGGTSTRTPVRGRPRFQIPPAPPAPAPPEDGWTMNQMMEQLHLVSWGQQHIYRKQCQIEAYYRRDRRGSQAQVEEGDEDDDEEEEGDEDDGDEQDGDEETDSDEDV